MHECFDLHIDATWFACRNNSCNLHLGPMENFWVSKYITKREQSAAWVHDMSAFQGQDKSVALLSSESNDEVVFKCCGSLSVKAGQPLHNVYPLEP